jgi:uncharacterized membrane protein YcfT
MSYIPGWPPEDAEPPAKPKPKPRHARVSRVWVRWMRLSLGLCLLSVVTLLGAIWVPGGHNGDMGLTASVIAVMSLPGFIIATSLWTRVPSADAGWCTTLGLSEVTDDDPL